MEAETVLAPPPRYASKAHSRTSESPKIVMPSEPAPAGPGLRGQVARPVATSRRPPRARALGPPPSSATTSRIHIDLPDPACRAGRRLRTASASAPHGRRSRVPSGWRSPVPTASARPPFSRAGPRRRLRSGGSRPGTGLTGSATCRNELDGLDDDGHRAGPGPRGGIGAVPAAARQPRPFLLRGDRRSSVRSGRCRAVSGSGSRMARPLLADPPPQLPRARRADQPPRPRHASTSWSPPCAAYRGRAAGRQPRRRLPAPPRHHHVLALDRDGRLLEAGP